MVGQLKVRPARHKAQSKGHISRAKRVLGSFHATCAEREEKGKRGREEMGARARAVTVTRAEVVIESGTSKKVEKQGVAADDEQVETLNICGFELQADILFNPN